LDADNPSTQTEAILGTPGYMAPEQAAGRRQEVGPRADIYALGAILYELLTGRPPFTAASPVDAVVQVLHNEPVTPRRLQPKVPRDLETICLKCLEKEPSKRYASAAEMAADLRRFQAGESIHARPAGMGERAIKWARRRPAAAALLGVSVIGALSLLASGLWYNARLHDQQRQTKAQYQEAREAIRRMLQHLDKREFATVPRLLELRRQQIDDALAFYREILDKEGGVDPDIRLDAAQAFEQSAKIENLLGENDAARAHARQAESLLRDLVERSSPDSDSAAHLVSSLNLRGICEQQVARFDQAEPFHREALRRCEAALQVDAAAARWLYQLAESHRLLGNVELLRSQFEQAEPHYLAMRETSSRLVEAHPGNLDYRKMLAESYARLGELWKHGPEKADANSRKAEEQFQDLIRDEPQNPVNEVALGALYHNWAKMWSAHDQPDRALELFARGIARLDNLRRREPQYRQCQGSLQALHGSRAYLLGSQKRFAEAVPDWDRVIDLEENGPQRNFRRSERAAVLAYTGQHGRAMAEVDELAADNGAEARTLYNAACAAVTCAKKVQSDVHVPSEDRGPLAERFTAKAVILLTRVRAAKLFTPSKFVEQLRAPDFEILQSRKDFQKLLIPDNSLPHDEAGASSK
jgi:tetratricopeptide (TPR) repeat protein